MIIVGLRQEQDLYIRLIDSATKQVIHCSVLDHYLSEYVYCCREIDVNVRRYFGTYSSHQRLGPVKS